ncbi:uncharacterized protein LOC106087275 [Stomoxys calcitrans]|uniref:uncharacterized protein LOC106087275 n=1 Tax=Stomoxys calcitrans TaxID=35570 RepID=UPI0027E24114|nr:uncharacterized protein LOC106087275 [Stomoxys calcitrans]
MTSQTNSTPNPVPAWIDVSLFEKIIKENVNLYKNITKFEVKPGSTAGENYATIILKINVEVELQDGSSKSMSFMVKTCHDSDMIREMLKSHNMFDVEKGMYDDIVPAFEKLYADAGKQVNFGPKSYKLDTQELYVLLENLSPRGFKNANRLEGLDMDHTESVLKKLALWHAASAVYAEKIGQYEDKYLYSMFREETKPMMRMVQEKFTNTFIDCAKSYSNYEVYQTDMEKFGKEDTVEAMYRITKFTPKEFNVLNHGDCWCNNIMFQYDAFGKIKETYLIDYQMPKYGTPAQDLYYFILSSTNLEIKLKKFDYFIKFYHSHLSENLKLLKYSKPIPKLSELHIMLFKYGLWGLSSAGGVMGVVLLDPTENANLDNFMGDGNEGDAFKRLMFSNDRYRKHIEAILPWLQDRGAFCF